MPSSITIPIVVVTDEHYVILLAVLLKSIESNHKTGEKIHIYVIEDNVTKKSKGKLTASVNPDIFSISWMKMEDIIPDGVKLPADRTSWPLTIYLRLFIEHIVPADTQKALFIDVDTIVLDDISKLYHTDMGENVLAAVQDPQLLTFDNEWGGIFNYKELGFAPDTKYLNTGVLMIDIPKWTEQKLGRRILNCITDNIKVANFPDQYGFNVVLANQWLQLDTRWNYFASGDLERPFLIHFISRKPIYTTYVNNPNYKELFEGYRKQTKWKNAKPIGELNRYMKKLDNVLTKMRKVFSVKILLLLLFPWM